MRITRFWAKNYRSLRDVDLVGLGPFNVFYGPNGSGKSNVLAGLRLLCAAFKHFSAGRDSRAEGGISNFVSVDKGAFDPRLDLFVDAPPPGTISLGVELAADDWALPWGPGEQHFAVELTIKCGSMTTPELVGSVLSRGPAPAAGTPDRAAWVEAVCERVRRDLGRRGFGMVDAVRYLREEARDPKEFAFADLSTLLDNGEWKRALFEASTSPSAETRQRFKLLQKYLEDEPLRRRPFTPVRDPATGEYDLREDLPSPDGVARDLPLSRVGLGVVQLYATLAKVLFHGSRLVGVEEPEAHLHAPTSGLHLRALLQRAVREKQVHQLFLATHSNLFDLDETGYWDVDLVDGATVIRRKELDQIDRSHLYEPGPAKHALQQLLRYAPPDEVVFRLPDDSAVTAAEMLARLQRDDEVAKSFLADLHGAALRVLRLQQRRPGTAT